MATNSKSGFHPSLNVVEKFHGFVKGVCKGRKIAPFFTLENPASRCPCGRGVEQRRVSAGKSQRSSCARPSGFIRAQPSYIGDAVLELVRTLHPGG